MRLLTFLLSSHCNFCIIRYLSVDQTINSSSIDHKLCANIVFFFSEHDHDFTRFLQIPTLYEIYIHFVLFVLYHIITNGMPMSCSQFYGGIKSFAILDSQIFLSGGKTSNEGTINILHNGQWGSVCSTRFDTNDARVVCSMLGYGYRYG